MKHLKVYRLFHTSMNKSIYFLEANLNLSLKGIDAGEDDEVYEGFGENDKPK